MRTRYRQSPGQGWAREAREEVGGVVAKKVRPTMTEKGEGGISISDHFIFKF